MEPLSPIDIARRQIEDAREYTSSLLETTPTELWYTTPEGSKSHIAWQVGHLAFAEYALCLVRVRGRGENDDSFLPPTFRRKFSKKSDPAALTADDFSVELIQTVFADVHRQVLSEFSSFNQESLADEIPMPYFVSPTKMGALLFCSHHEMLHAGQIGLIRRNLGLDPVR